MYLITRVYGNVTTVGYSTGVAKDAADKDITSGGQCENGLKMVVLIGENPNPNLNPNTPGMLVP